MRFQEALTYLIDAPKGTVMTRCANPGVRFKLSFPHEPGSPTFVQFLTTQPTPLDFFAADWQDENWEVLRGINSFYKKE